MRKVVIAGGTGFIGAYLKMRFAEYGYLVTIISRNGVHNWDHENLVSSINSSDVLINLSGKSINCRHTEANKKEILHSRIQSTERLCNAIAACLNPPKLWINASAAGIYEPSIEYVNTEDSGKYGTSFLAHVVLEWEKVFFSCKLPKTRKVAMRTSVVLGKDGGALKPLISITKLGLGGIQGNGNQIFSWIHIEDFFQQILYIFEHEPIHGAINASSPLPISNSYLMSVLRSKLKIPFGLPAPRVALKFGAFLMGTESDLILESVNISPKKLVEAGFVFKYPSIESALDSLIEK
jgi:uncharacterized protein (TIGR01777 family)